MSTPIRHRRPITVALALAIASVSPIAAQEPGDRAELERVVFRAFPEADALRCISRDVDQKARRIVEARLPFRVHFNELGEHRLLVAFRGRRPVGLVYRRIEEADWGLTEIAWQLSLDLRVVGFDVLRGRNTNVGPLLRSPFARDLVGQSLPELRERLAAFAAPAGDHDAGLLALQRMTLRSAIKALTVTDVVWRDEITKLSDQATGFDLFPAAARFVRRATTFDLPLEEARPAADLKAVFAYDQFGERLGCVAWTTHDDAGRPLALRWVVDRDQRIVGLEPLEADANRDVRTACAQLRGRTLLDPGDLAGSLPALSRSLGALLPELDDRRVRR